MDYFLRAVSSAFGLIFSLDAEIYLIVWTSLWISLFAVGIAATAAVPLGLLVALRRFRGRTLILHALNTLMAVPTVVVGLLLYGMFTRQGPLGGLGILYTPFAIVIGQAILVLPIIWNLSISAAASADPRLRATCLSLGASGLQQGLIVLSEVRFGMLAAIVAGFGRAIGEVGIAMMLGGNISGYTRTMTTAIALETSKGEFEFGLALGVLLLATAFIVNGLLQCFQRLDR
jgi:tungstate transport system permease protein